MNDKFCYMPWYGLTVAANGNIKPCCQYKGSIANTADAVDIRKAYNSTKMIQLREEFLAGEMPEECQSCWEREELIGTSRRLWFIDKFDIPDDTLHVTVCNPQWIQADINLSNVCNLKCRMCGSWGSSMWFAEELLLAHMDDRFQKNKNALPIVQHDLESIKSLLPGLENIQRIDFKGGEPMLAKHHDIFLEWLIEHGYRDVTLQYTTNGTVVNDRIISLLSKFKDVRIMFSIEGTGELYEYIRGGKYTTDDFEKVFNTYDQLPNVTLGFNVTIQAYNLLNLYDLYGYLNDLAFNSVNGSAVGAFNTICNQPDYLSPFVVPDKYVNVATANLNEIPDFDHLVRSLEKRWWDEEKWKTFVDYTMALDLSRKTNVVNYIPEFAEYFNASCP